MRQNKRYSLDLSGGVILILVFTGCSEFTELISENPFLCLKITFVNRM